MYSKVSLNTLLEYTTSESVLRIEESKLADKIASLCTSRSERWANERAKKLMEAAQRNPFKSTLYHSHLISLEMYIQMLLQYQEHLAKLDGRIDALAGEIEEYKIIQSIPGIGEKTLQRFFLKLVRSRGLIILKNWLPSLKLIRVSIRLVNLQRR